MESLFHMHLTSAAYLSVRIHEYSVTIRPEWYALNPISPIYVEIVVIVLVVVIIIVVVVVIVIIIICGINLSTHNSKHCYQQETELHDGKDSLPCVKLRAL